MHHTHTHTNHVIHAIRANTAQTQIYRLSQRPYLRLHIENNALAHKMILKANTAKHMMHCQSP